jgi:hypothetical protein
MAAVDELLPPAHLLHERLSANEKERYVLRALLRLVYRDQSEPVRLKSQAESQHPRHTAPL